MNHKELCIHAHFYQPPREDPFTGVIAPELGAEPYSNFNEKVTAECYRPNAELGNFELISFNLGPTLASWLESYDPVTYQRILDSDRKNVMRYGVGNAIAQAYNHTILPLATRRDKETQVAWGIADFRHRFGRDPQGMWLPEMAVDTETLEVLAEQGITFTILCPHQVHLPDNGWADSIRYYETRLPLNRRIALFLRDEELSNRIAFDQGITQNAANFIHWCLINSNNANRLYLIATDGETFGHHQPGREHFLHDLLSTEAPQAGCQVTYLGRHLREYPPSGEAEIVEDSSWSCGHGVDRWYKGCTCTPGISKWKGQLRTALDRLAGGIDALYLHETKGRVSDPWALRNAYIHVMLGEMSGEALLREYAGKALTTDESHRLLTMLEAQRFRQAMYTSCAWFFEDLSRLEPRYVIANAARAIRLVEEATGVSLEDGFRRDLAQAESWITYENGADIYDEIVKAHPTLPQV
ncbi:MAG: DUF3536 domain-containing protein [Anaerolineae bacterium]|nr:DUF3536 domain-containing protein [Anaerolineae bacterium]